MDSTLNRETTSRKNAACDECRTAKVKCSGDENGCARCRLHGIQCHFSDRKTMGRPRKRIRQEDPGPQKNDKGGSRNDAPDDTNQAVTGGSDISHPHMDPFDARPSNTTGTSHGNVSSWENAPSVTPSLNLTDDWQIVQDANTDGLQDVDAPHVNVSVNGESFHMTEPHLSSAEVPPPQDLDPINISCSCLNELYSMLMSFQSLPSPAFPLSRAPLVRATDLARAVVRCPFCPRDFPSALQNIMLLNTLLPLVVHSYGQLLTAIQEQAARGQSITYRVGDLAHAASTLHTGTPDCPMGFNVELDSDEGAAMARKVVKQDMYGNGQSTDCLLGVVEELEQRQQFWHLLQDVSPRESCPSHRQSDGPHEHDALCLRLTGRVRGAIADLHL